MDNLVLYGVAIITFIISNVLLIMLGMLLYRSLTAKPVEPPANPDPIPQELRQDLKALAVSLSVLGERLNRIESHIQQLQEQREQQPTVVTTQDADHKAFQVAAKMALQGADVEELINLCGLTRGEAELIRMLHRGQQDKPSGLGAG